MISISHKSRAHAVAAALATAAAVLYRFPPERYHFYPQCPVFRYLHMYCPGCGATRALAALLHGRLVEALHYNAFVVLLLPPVVYFLIRTYARILRGESFAWPEISPAAINFLLLAGSLFVLLRNTMPAAL
ncbi:MAG: DUF2752 domain-containing protein [Acidobacteriota bacterium]|nr:DUF2752 domain-containing protein [Acidobacteriota bacterium]